MSDICENQLINPKINSLNHEVAAFEKQFPIKKASTNTYNISGQKAQDFSTTCIGNQREINQITISSVCTILQLKAATCTASSTDLSGTSSRAHIFYTSK